MVLEIVSQVIEILLVRAKSWLFARRVRAKGGRQVQLEEQLGLKTVQIKFGGKV